MDGFGDIELVHGRQNDGGRGQEKQHHKQREVDAQPLEPPADALDGEILPAGATPAKSLNLCLPYQPCPWLRHQVKFRENRLGSG